MLSHSNLEKFFWSVLLAFLACFASARVVGLQPDASLYAGLARRVWVTQEFWTLSAGTQMFERFYEHPPYFFQWGAWIMSWAGVNELSAKMMGALPSFVGLCLLLIFCSRVWGVSVGLWTIFVLATTGHFTKYAATSMMEGPLALGVLLSAIGSYGALVSPRNGYRLLSYLCIGLGVSLSCATKGIVGLGALGGALLVFIGQIFVENRSLVRFFYIPFYLFFLMLWAALPFAFWLYQSFKTPELLNWLHGYLFEQVLRSATTDRGEAFFKEANNYFYYILVIVRNVWPWWWTVPLALWGVVKGVEPLRQRTWLLWSLVAVSYLLAFVIPLSLVTYKLPHYMHPTYMLMAPLGAIALKMLFQRVFGAREYFFTKPVVRWGVLILLCALMWIPAQRVSTSSNRGQEFIAVQEEIRSSPKDCRVLVSKEDVDRYRMTAFSLWYFDGRSWDFVERRYPSKIAVPADAIYWEPQSKLIWKGKSCT